MSDFVELVPYKKWRHLLCAFHLWKRFIGYETEKNLPIELDFGNDDRLFCCAKCNWAATMKPVKPFEVKNE